MSHHPLSKLVEKLIASPKKPKKDVKPEDMRFPHVVVPEEELQQSVVAEVHSEVASGVFHNQTYDNAQQRQFARWTDHRTLLRRRASPKKLPEDVPDYIMNVVEDVRAAKLVEKAGLRYQTGKRAAQTFFMNYGHGKRLLPAYRPSFELQEDADAQAKALAQEVLGILTTLPYLDSPGSEQVRERIDKSFHPRMKAIIDAVEGLFEQSDLSFADSHHIGRILRDLLQDLPNPEEGTPPPIPIPLAGGGEGKAGSPGPGKLSARKPGGKGAGGGSKLKSGLGEDDTVDWRNYQHTPSKLAANVRSQLSKIRNRAFGAYAGAWGGRPNASYGQYFGSGQIASLKREGAAAYGKYYSTQKYSGGGHYDKSEGPRQWGATMRIDKPKLTHTTVRPSDVGRGYRHSAHESGRVPRNMHRWATDQRVFSVKRHRKGGIALLCDCSGSMSLSVNDIDRVLEKVPASIIACYSGGYDDGDLRIVAKDGRRVNRSLVGSGGRGANCIDGPALNWLAKQKNTGKYWLSDGLVTGYNERTSAWCFRDADRLCVEHNIYQVRTISELFKVIFEGKPLQDRTMRHYCESYHGVSW
jgi:hypothetical protein